MRYVFVSLAAGALLAVLSGAQDNPAPGGYRPAERRENNLLMREFKPESMLHLPAHDVKRAKFPVIDIHNHVNGAFGERKDPRELVKMMDDLNIKSEVILTGGQGAAIQKVIDEMVKPYPGRFFVFTQIDWSKLKNPDFSQSQVAAIRDAVERGARGLKILKDLGLMVRDPKTQRLITIDDPRIDPVWEECARLHIPVAIHIADPEAFFHRIDSKNERYDELQRHPDWGFCCPPKFPTIQELMDQRDRMIAKHPNTTFILLHFGNWPENLDHVERTLQKFPNTVVEFGARQAELGRQPLRSREFFLKYPDRVLFGTDIEPTAPMYQSYFRWLETADEHFEYFGYPGQGFWKISGLSLPDDVLKKVYYQNAERILDEHLNRK